MASARAGRSRGKQRGRGGVKWEQLTEMQGNPAVGSRDNVAAKLAAKRGEESLLSRPT